MAKKGSIRDEIEALKESVDEIREATVDKEGKRSLPAGTLQRGVESIAGKAGARDPNAAWNTTKDVARAFIPQKIEALARSKFRGEDYEDANAKADESREDLENRRSGLHATGAATQSLAGTVAGIALYAKLANSGSARPPVQAPVAPAPAPAATPKGNLKAMGRFGLLAAAGAAVGSYLMSKNAASSSPAAPAAPAAAAPQQQPSPSPAATAMPVPIPMKSAPAASVAKPQVKPSAKPAAARPGASSTGPQRPKREARQQQQRRQAQQQQKRRSSGPVDVPGYTRADGVRVEGYRRQRTM